VIGTRASIYTSGDSLFSPAPGHGGKICTRIVNGVDTGEPLFPLPISAVLQSYMNHVLQRTPINIEADIEEAAGVPIPAPCRNAPLPTATATPVSTSAQRTLGDVFGRHEGPRDLRGWRAPSRQGIETIAW
jgi:hypothetical protein